MIITNLRSSSINTFKSCPMAWFLEYNLGWDSGANKAAVKGTVVHKVLELLALLKKADQDGKISIQTQTTPARLHVKNYLTTNRLIDKLTGSIYNSYRDKYDLNWTAQDKKDCVNWVNKILGGEFDPRHHNIIDAEYFFDIEIVESWSVYKYELPNENILKGFLHILGTIDLIIKTKTGIEVIDWKTGQRKDWNKDTNEKKTIDDIRNDIQPRMYHYVLSKKFPDQQIIVTMVYINDGGEFSVYFDKKDLSKTKKLIQHYFKTIQGAIPICHKSWKCNKFCNFGKTGFDNTSVIPLFSNDKMFTKCEQMEYVLQHKTVNQALTHMCNGSLEENLNAYRQG